MSSYFKSFSLIYSGSVCSLGFTPQIILIIVFCNNKIHITFTVVTPNMITIYQIWIYEGVVETDQCVNVKIFSNLVVEN